MNENIKDNDNLETPVVKGKKSRDIWDYILAFVASVFLIVSCFATYHVGYSNGSSDMYDECTAILDDYVEELEVARSASTTMVVEDEEVDDVVEEVDDVVEQESVAVVEEEQVSTTYDTDYYSPAYPNIILDTYIPLPDYADKDKLIEVAKLFMERKGHHNIEYIQVCKVWEDYAYLWTDGQYYYVDLTNMNAGSYWDTLEKARYREMEYIVEDDPFHVYGDYYQYKIVIDETCTFDIVGGQCIRDVVKGYRTWVAGDKNADIGTVYLTDFDGQYGTISGSAGSRQFYLADTTFVIENKIVTYNKEDSYLQNWETWN